MNLLKGAFTNPFDYLLWLIILIGWVALPIKCTLHVVPIWAGITGFCIFIYIMGYLNDKKNWNNGVCPKCERGFWKSFDCDSQGGTGYKCTFCENSHWQNGSYDHVIRISSQGG